MPEPSLPLFAAVAGVVFLAAFAQGVTGFGSALVAMPLLASSLIGVPVGVLLLAGTDPRLARGLLGGAFNANGPAVALYAAARGWGKGETHATLQLYFLVSGLLIAALHGAAGLTSRQVLLAAFLALPFLAAGAALLIAAAHG